MDYDWLLRIHRLAGHEPLDTLMRFAAKDLIFLLFAVLGVLCLQRLRTRSLQDVLWTGGALVASFALGLAVAAAHPEMRPFTTHRELRPLVKHAAGQSFPSDHATAAFAVAFAILAFLSWRIGVAVLVGAFLVGFARVYVGVHYPGDILASFAVAASGVGVIALVRRQFFDQDRVPDRPSTEVS